MSPKSRGRKTDRRPSDRQRQRQRERRRNTIQIPEEMVQAILGNATQLLDLESPLQAEVFASGILSAGRVDVPPAQADDAENAFGEALVEAFAQAGNQQAAVMLSVFGALAAPPVALRARTALAELGEHGDLPAWTEQVGNAKLVDGLRIDDTYGDGVALALAFQYVDEPPHGFSVTVDYTAGATITDAWPAESAEELLTGVRAEAEEDGEVTVAPIEAADVAALVSYGYTVADQAATPRTEDADDMRTLLLSRLRALPAGGVGPPVRRWNRHERDELVDAFIRSPELAEVAAADSRDAELNPELVEDIAATIVEEGCAADLGRPLRISPAKLDRSLHALLDVVGAEEVADATAIVGAWIRFAARRGDDAALEQTLAALDELEEGFQLAVTNPELVEAYEAGMAVITGDLDVDALTEDEYEAAVQRRIFALPEPPDSDFDPDSAESFLAMARAEHPDEEADKEHVEAHAAITRQLWFDEPAAAWETAQRLLEGGYERTDVLHALAHAYAQSQAGTQQDNPAAYADALAALPQSWESAPQG